MTSLRLSVPSLRDRRASRPARQRSVRLSATALEARDCPAVNLIANPSVETAASSTAPAGWRADRWGNNTVAFSYPPTGLDGQRSVRVDMTARNSGDAKWYFDDVPVTPGQAYSFSDLYSSDVSTHATLRYRMANGNFKYTGYFPAAAGTGRTLNFNFTPPANAVAATVFHVIETPGFLVTDGFSLAGPDAPTPDTTAPTVAVTAPAAGTTVSGTINLTAAASDNVGVVGVRFLIDGNPFGTEDTTAPYSVAFNTGTVASGNHTVAAVARDAAGNSTTSTAVTFGVAAAPPPDTTAPTVAVTAPAANATVSGTINLTATASDDVGVVGTRFFVDGTAVGTEDTTAPYSRSFNTASLAPGSHTVTAVARDAAGNSTTSAPVSFAVADSAGPTVALTAPTPGPAVSGTIDLAAQASDNVGVAGVRFFVDGNLVGPEDTTAPYQASLDTTTLTNGSHTLTAVARDAAGNATTSAALTITVANGPTPSPTNLIQNPSLETLGTNGDPAGWARNGWGTNSPTYSLVPGTDGARAARVDVTAYTSGDAKWVFADVPVSPTTTYMFSDAYRSNVSTQLVIQYRLADGSFSYAWVADLAPAENWTNASYQVTTPAAVTAMTVFHLIHSVGWLETDRYALAAAAPGGGPPGQGMVSLTFDDGWRSQFDNAVPVLQQADLPASFYVITRANQGGQAWELVQNPSLETAAPTSDANAAVPVGWNTYRTGTNTTAFNYATSGVDGNRSARIDVTSYTSGDAAWYFRDVAVEGGTQYTLSHQYNATVPTSLLVRFTNNNGGISWVDLGGLASTGGQWQTRQFTVTAPANADAMTVLHRISRVGTLWTDDYSVKPVNPFSNPSYMTPAQIQGLQAAGFEVGSHTMTHADLTTLSAAGARAEIEGSRADLLALGVTPTTFAYPYGSFNTAVRQAVVTAGYVAARSVNTGYNTGTTDRFALMYQEVNLGTTAADVQGWVNAAVQNGTWLILTFHQVDNSGGEFSTTPETFQQIVNMVTASNLAPVTMAQGVARL